MGGNEAKHCFPSCSTLHRPRGPGREVALAQPDPGMETALLRDLGQPDSSWICFSLCLLGRFLQQPAPDGRPLPLLSRPACDLGLPGNLCPRVWSSRRAGCSLTWAGDVVKRGGWSRLALSISLQADWLPWVVVPRENGP